MSNGEGRPAGRPAGRPLTKLELQHFHLLLFGRQRAQFNTTWFEERLEDFTLQTQEDGASVRGIAEAVGVNPSTVQKWIRNATQRRSVPEE